jgi:hypothetical protein
MLSGGSASSNRGFQNTLSAQIRLLKPNQAASASSRRIADGDGYEVITARDCEEGMLFACR